MLRLDWSMINERDGTLTIEAQKTHKCHVIPIHPVLWTHLKMIHGPLDRIFPVEKSTKQLRQELKLISEAVGVRNITPKMLRRAAATEWERARSGAGQYIQRSTLRNSSRFYIDTTQLLRKAIDPSSTVGVVNTGKLGRKSFVFNGGVSCRDGDVVPQVFWMFWYLMDIPLE